MAEENNHEPTPESTPDPLFVVDDSTKEFLDKYVGPGKKYANIGELAKGYANADTHIQELTRDAGTFKTEAESLKELLMESLVNPKSEEKPNDNNNSNPPPNDADGHQKPDGAAPPKEDGKNVDLKALVKEALSEVSAEDVRKKNALTTEEATIKRFGSKEDALKAIQQRAEELEVSPQWIANLAFESPKAYFSAMGFKPDEQPKSNNTPAPGSDVNPRTLEQTSQGAKPNTYKWYQELRRTNPQKYRSAEIQTAIMRDAQENPNFYS